MFAQVSANVSDLFPAEKYFYQLTLGLNLLAPTPELSRVRAILVKNMPQRVERFIPRLSDLENPAHWLSLILKTNFLIRLWDVEEQPVCVGLDVSGSLKSAVEQLQTVQSQEFRIARQELGISKHWFIVIPGCPPVGPSKDELLDALYKQLERQEECGIINVSAKTQECI